MKLISIFACLCLLALTLACSNEENTSEPQVNTEADSPANPRESETHSVVPVKTFPRGSKAG